MATVSGQETVGPSELGGSRKQCLHFDGGSEFNEPFRLRRIKERYPEDYKQLESQLQEVVGNYLGAISRQNFEPFKKYISQVICYRGEQHRKRCVERLRNNSLEYNGKLLIWVDEGDHLHIVHDCAYSNGSCRCRLFQGEDFRGPVRASMRRNRLISELDTIDFANVFLYFILSKRSSDSQIWIGRRLQRPPSEHQIVQWKSMHETSSRILAGEDKGVGHDTEQQESIGEDDRNSFPTLSGTSKKKRSTSESNGETPVAKRRKTKFERISEAIQTLLVEYFPIPANSIKHLLVDKSNYMYLFDPSNEKYYDGACEYFTVKMNKYTLSDFRDLYMGKTPIFYANDINNPWSYYHSLEDSVKYVDELLRFQLEDNEDDIRNLLININNWFNKYGWDQNPKINAIAIIGPHNCGKNYFWDMLAAIAFNVGHIGRVNNKCNQFALQEVPNKRFIMGNEISMEDGAKEDFKKLCEGAAMNVRVKFKGDRIYTKTPVCLISNKTLDITHDPTFKDVRLHTMRWKQCSLLKHSTLKPYPLALFELYNMYNVYLH